MSQSFFFATPGSDERAALQMDDLASALDAGLPLPTLGGDVTAGDGVLQSVLEHRRISLSATEIAVLAASWRAGRAPQALRQRAEQRRRRAEFTRRMLAAMRYPMLLMGVTMLASLATMAIVGHLYVPISVGLVLLLLAAVAGAFFRLLRSESDAWRRVPYFGSLANDFAELPYLDTLAALYGAGVPLPQAHQQALATVPFPAMRQRLRQVTAAFASGRNLTDGLQQGHCVHPETAALLATGEQSGQLEDALLRAADRRRTVAMLRTDQAVRWFTAGFYGLAMLAAAAVILLFYSSLMPYYHVRR